MSFFAARLAAFRIRYDEGCCWSGGSSFCRIDIWTEVRKVLSLRGCGRWCMMTELDFLIWWCLGNPCEGEFLAIFPMARWVSRALDKFLRPPWVLSWCSAILTYCSLALTLMTWLERSCWKMFTSLSLVTRVSPSASMLVPPSLTRTWLRRWK